MRKVKCYATKEWGTDETFYKAEGHYFKDEKTYAFWKEQNAYYKSCVAKLSDLLGLDDGYPFPPFLTKKIIEYKIVGYKILFETITDCEPSIQWAVKNKDFTNLKGAIQYVFRIIANHIPDTVKRVKEEEKQKQIRERKMNAQPVEVETEIASNPTVKNLSQWLED